MRRVPRGSSIVALTSRGIHPVGERLKPSWVRPLEEAWDSVVGQSTRRTTPGLDETMARERAKVRPDADLFNDLLLVGIIED